MKVKPEWGMKCFINQCREPVCPWETCNKVQIWSLTINFNSLSGKLTKGLSSSTLDLACHNGKLFANDDKFTSLDFDQVISWVFDFSSYIHIIWIMMIAHWGPFSLLVVSLMLVNSLHHWLGIKRLSNILDINTSIIMLGCVSWSGHVGVKNHGVGSQNSRLWSDMTWLWWYACLLQMVGCNHNSSYHMWSFSLFDGCDPTFVSIWSSLMDGCTHTWIHLHDNYLDGFTNATIHVSFDRDLSLMYMYLYMLVGFLRVD